MKQNSFCGMITVETSSTLSKRKLIMKQTMKTIVWLVAFLGISSIQVFGKPFAVGPYLGQTPPGPIAKVFAPGLICNSGQRTWEVFGTFSANGNTFCFQRISGVFITENTDQGWTTPELIRSIQANMYAPWPSHHKNPYSNPFRAIADPLLRKKRRMKAKPCKNAIGIKIIKSFEVNSLG